MKELGLCGWGAPVHARAGPLLEDELESVYSIGDDLDQPTGFRTVP